MSNDELKSVCVLLDNCRNSCVCKNLNMLDYNLVNITSNVEVEQR